MFNDLMAKLPLASDHNDEPLDPRTAEEIAADDKAERIRFHRNKVRNGPASFTMPTNGQIRRAQKRRAKTQQRKDFKGRVRTYFAQQRELSVLRGNLQFAGVIPFYDETMEPTRLQVECGLTWIIEHYLDGDDQGVTPALTRALNRYQELAGLKQTPLSPAYVIPGVGDPRPGDVIEDFEA